MRDLEYKVIRFLIFIGIIFLNYHILILFTSFIAPEGFINEVENVRIDSNLNGILERRALKREIISIDKEIKKLMEDIKAEVKVDTIVIPDKTSKKRERELNKLYRMKNRQEKRFNETQLIEINIITN